MTQTISTTYQPGLGALDDAYHVVEQQIAARVRDNREPLFTTAIDPDALWAAYLAAFPEEHRQHYTCNGCRHFVERYGGLVTLAEDGTATPFLWAGLDAPEAFAPVVDRMARAVAAQKVVGVFRWSRDTWGVPSNVSKKTGATWTHLHGTPGVHHERRGATPDQQMAALKEDFGILARSLDDYSLAVVEEAVRVLQSGTLTRSEKAEGVATWFLSLHRAVAASPKQRRNLMWRAVATAPPGFTHVRTTVVSTLLDDIVAGLSFADVARRWSEKLHPLQYQRPQAAPKAGQIEAAERKVAELGITASLRRRYATLDDVLATLWRPAPVEPAAPKAGGVFDVLREAQGVKAFTLPTQRMTWRKFSEDVLPAARAVEIQVPHVGPFYGLLTAADPDAPPIIQWDGLEGHPRNPVSWYFYHAGSLATLWGLTPGWASVAAVFAGPYAWQEPTRFQHHGRHVFFALPAAKDSRANSVCLFPEIMRADLREIRSVLEGYSRKVGPEGAESGNANGLAFNGQDAATLRVTTAQGVATYTVDRWE